MSDKAFSENTGVTYDSWEELLKAESNGLVVIVTSSRPKSRPGVFGPFMNKAEAVTARAALKAKMGKSEGIEGFTVTTQTRILWDENVVLRGSRREGGA